MATSTLTNYTTIPSPPVASVYAEMRYGSNGSDGGLPELLLGNNGSDATSGRMCWDDADGAFDSGIVFFSMNIPPGGGSANPDTLSVTGAVTTPITYSLTTYGTVSEVQVVAGVQINASSAVTDLIIQFYKGGTLIETFNLTAGPSVDTTTASNPVAAQVLAVTPAASNNDQVVVSGNVQMQAPAGTYPNVDDIFVQVFIQTSTSGSGLTNDPSSPAPGTVGTNPD